MCPFVKDEAPQGRAGKLEHSCQMFKQVDSRWDADDGGWSDRWGTVPGCYSKQDIKGMVYKVNGGSKEKAWNQRKTSNTRRESQMGECGQVKESRQVDVIQQIGNGWRKVDRWEMVDKNKWKETDWKQQTDGRS